MIRGKGGDAYSWGKRNIIPYISWRRLDIKKKRSEARREKGTQYQTNKDNQERTVLQEIKLGNYWCQVGSLELEIKKFTGSTLRFLLFSSFLFLLR
ncbi:hypothetical protein HanIR_Chr01g0036371 [Helianthus annuus]|nr:hypothetical protein HanIR_Chr01g0036371 [Helianthus annuus]